MDNKIILTDNKGNILNITFSYPLTTIINTYKSQKVDKLHFKLYDIPVTYLTDSEPLYLTGFPQKFTIVPLFIDEEQEVWNRVAPFIYMEFKATLKILNYNTIYVINSIDHTKESTIKSLLTNLIPSDMIEAYISEGPLFAKTGRNHCIITHLNTVNLSSSQYKQLGNIEVTISFNNDHLSEEQIYNFFLILRKYFPSIVKLNTGIEIIPVNIDESEYDAVLSSYLQSFYNQIPFHINYTLSFFPVLSIYTNVLVHEINKIAEYKIPFIDECPKPTPEFLEEYEAEKQIIQLKDNF